jgi:hypothetical protein
MRFIKPALTLCSLWSAAFAVGCRESPTVPELNNVTTAAINSGLTKASVASLVNGIVDGDHRNFGFAHVVFAETMARDVYNLDPAESRFITEALQVPPDNAGFLGGGDWIGWFIVVRTANTVLDNLSTANDMTAQEKSAATGLIQTYKAIEIYHALEQRDSLGAPIDLDTKPGAPPAEFRCKPNVLAYLSALLDSGYTSLQAGGSAFPFSLPPGFSLNGTFNTPATFTQFNRAWAGKIEVYRGLDHTKPDAAAFGRALTDFGLSFVSTSPVDMKKGVYYTYSTAVGEFAAPLFAATIHLNPAVGDSILAGDLRSSKIVVRATVASRNGVSTKYDDAITVTTNSANVTRSMQSFINEELVLLRAQAEIGSGDLASATNDLNYVHVNSGGLAPYATFASSAAAISALLYEKRYSLLLEGGAHRLVDLRAYNRFNAANLKMEFTNDAFTAALPIPQGDVQARSGNVTPVCK